MRRIRPAALFPTAFALGAIIFVPEGAAAREQEPIEIKTCQVISQPGSYVLSNNLTGHNPSNNNCLFIKASFVTIDLAGFLISGVDGAAIATLNQQLQGIAMRNGVISGGAGVILEGTGSIVEGLRVFADPSLPGIGQGIVADGIVKGNIVSGRATGIQARGTVTGNFVENNRGEGMVVSPGSTVIGNTALNNGDVGISVLCPSNLTDNTATGSTVNIQLIGDGCHNEDNLAP